MALIGLIAGLWAASLAGWSRWSAARIDPVVRIWQRFCDRARRGGLPREPAEGPLAFAERAASHWPGSRDLIVSTGKLYADLRYGTGASDRDRIERLRRSARAVRFERAGRRSTAFSDPPELGRFAAADSTDPPTSSMPTSPAPTSPTPTSPIRRR
jgi:hypothetical protein